MRTIRETIRKDNELDLNMGYDRTLWCNLIHVTDSTYKDKLGCCCFCNT